MSALGNLVVSLALDHAKFSDGLSKSEHAAKKTAAELERTFGVLKAGVAGVLGGLGAVGMTGFIKQSIDAADNLNDLSKKTGIAIENLAGLQLVVDKSGTTMEMLGGGVAKLNKTLGEAASGSKSAQTVLRDLGITATDPMEAFYQLADAFGRFKTEGDKANAMSQVIGKTWGELAPALAEGGDGLRRMVEEGQRLNPITREMAEQADKFNDAMSRFKAEANGIGTAIASTLLPAMNNLLERWNDAIRLSSSHGGFVGLVLGGINPTGENSRNLKAVRDEIAAIQLQLKDAGTTHGDIAGIDGARLKARLFELKAIKKSLEEIQRREALALNDQYGTGRYKMPGQPESPRIKLTPSGSEKSAKPKDRMSATEWSMEESAHLTRTYYQIQQEASEEYTAQLRNEFDAEWALIALQDDQYRAGRDAAARWTEAIDPMQKYRDDLEEIARLEREGYLTAEKALAAQFLVHEQMDKALAANNEALKEQNDISRELGLTLTSTFEDAMVSGKKFGQVMAGAAQDLYRLFLRKTVSEPAGNWFTSALASSGIGSLFGNWFSSGGASNLNAFSSMDFGSINAFSTAFARGGIMTDRGPLPLHTYAGGGIADRPQLAVFGEGRRPEAYVPLPDGRSIPVTMQGGGGVTIVQHFDFRNASADAEAKLRAEAGRIKRETLAALMDNLNRGGAFAQATGRI